MRKFFGLFVILFSIFFIPNNVFAADNALYIPYYNRVSDFSLEQGIQLKQKLYEHSDVVKDDGDKCIVLYKEQYNSVYHLICSPNLSDVILLYYSNTNSFGFYFSNIKYYRFNEKYEITFNSTGYSFSSSSNSFENLFLYSDVSFKFSKINGIDKVLFYDINDSTNIYGEFISDNSTLYSYSDFYLTEPNEDIVIFEDNDFHSISKLILGDNIPAEFSFVYMISDYLLLLLLVIIIISPIAIIIKIMRW